MRAVYLPNSYALSDDEKEKYQGSRFENADAFQGVTNGVDLAVIIGDYPEIVSACKKAKVKYDVVKVEAEKPEKAEKSEVKPEVKQEPKK